MLASDSWTDPAFLALFKSFLPRIGTGRVNNDQLSKLMTTAILAAFSLWLAGQLPRAQGLRIRV